MKETKKNWKIEPGILIMMLIATALIVFMIWCMYISIATENATSIIRIQYTGLENMFHPMYEYYAVDSKNNVHNVSYYIDLNKERQAQFESYDKYNDNEENNYWYIGLLDKSYNHIDDKDSTIVDSDINSRYAWKLSNALKKSRSLTEEEIELFCRLLDNTYKDRLNNSDTDANDIFIQVIQSDNTGNYIVITEYEIYLLDIESSNEKLVRIMDIPERGDFSYWYSFK